MTAHAFLYLSINPNISRSSSHHLPAPSSPASHTTLSILLLFFLFLAVLLCLTSPVLFTKSRGNRGRVRDRWSMNISHNVLTVGMTIFVQIKPACKQTTQAKNNMITVTMFLPTVTVNTSRHKRGHCNTVNATQHPLCYQNDAPLSPTKVILSSPSAVHQVILRPSRKRPRDEFP